MSAERLRARWEALESEQLKTAAELTLRGLSRHRFGQHVFEIVRGGERVEDPRLGVELPGLTFENPVMVGAGWSKKGWEVDGLYDLGFAGVEVGSVLLHPQAGNPRPRLWYEDGAALNRMGFNSPGAVAVAQNLAAQERKGIIGVNISRNKLSPEDQAPAEFAEAAQLVYDYADYFVINFQSPNTPGLRDSMMRLLEESFIAVNEAQATKGTKKPILFKTSVDMSKEDIARTIQIAVDVGAAGIVDTNTTTNDELKTKYGWAGQAGGLSGDIPELRQRANENMAFITRESKGTGLIRMGVGAISDSSSAIERSMYGAQIVQVVTGIRQNKGKTAQNINRGYLAFMDAEGIKNYEEIVGLAL